MARETRTHYLTRGRADSAAATLASAQNPDGTAYTLPVSGSVTTDLPAAATPNAVAAGAGDAAVVAPTANLRLMGVSYRESAASEDVASFTLRHGIAAGDPALMFVELGPDQSDTIWFGESGIACAGGIFLDRTVGETEVVVYTKVAA